MDGDRFDTWTRTMAARASRRLVLRALVGGALGGVAALLGTGPKGVAAASDPQCPADQPFISNQSCSALSCGNCGAGTCSQAVNGSRKCLDRSNFACPTRDECDRNRDCPEGQVCAKVGACCGRSRRNVCLPKCSV